MQQKTFTVWKIPKHSRAAGMFKKKQQRPIFRERKMYGSCV